MSMLVNICASGRFSIATSKEFVWKPKNFGNHQTLRQTTHVPSEVDRRECQRTSPFQN